MENQLQFLNYRAKSIWKSFKVLYNLPEEKVQAFLDSYEVYNYDWKNERELIEELGPDYYKEIQKKIIDWYSVLNHLCALGEVEKMYIPPVMDPCASIMKNQRLFERRMAKDLAVGRGDQVLDIGCGRGCIAMHVASLTGANIVGINIDTDQLKTAKKVAAWKGLEDQCHFQITDMNHLPLPFDDNSFDGVYQVQVFSLSKDLLKLFKEIYRIMRPGAKFCALDYVGLPDYDPDNDHHRALLRAIKPLIGAIGTPSSEEYVRLLEKAGFHVKIKRNLSVDGLQEPLINKVDVYFNRVYKAIKVLTRCKVLPKHFVPMMDRLTQDGQAFVEADRLRLVTTSYYIVAQKPIKK